MNTHGEFRSIVRGAAQLEGADIWLRNRIDELSAQVRDADRDAFQAIKRVAVIGAGAMGRCIALALARVGKRVSLFDTSMKSLESAEKFIVGYIQGQFAKGRLNPPDAKELESRIIFSSSFEDVAEAGLVVEAVPEDLSLKQEVMKNLEQRVAGDCILATNTSTLDLDAIAGAVERSERVIGTHFFIPAHVTHLLEIVPSIHTSDTVVRRMQAMALVMGKVFVVAGNCDGFIGNRLFDRFHQEAMYLLEEGATPEQVDRLLEDWGMAMGPFRVLDLVGNDIPWPVRRQRQRKNPSLLHPRMGDALCETGRYGQKTGSGWYDYVQGSREPRKSQKTHALLLKVSEELGIRRRAVTDDEILGRCILSLVNEGCAILREGFAQCETDIDLVYVNGYGFPARIGGPTYLIHKLGADKIVDEMRHYQGCATHGEKLWQPDPSLLDVLNNHR